VVNKSLGNIETYYGEVITAKNFLKKVSMAKKNGKGLMGTQAENGVWEQEFKKIHLKSRSSGL